MSKSALNITLQRPILDGDKYNALFSFSKCTPTPLGNGDTKFTITQMKQQVLIWVKELNTKKVQQLFGKPTLEETVTNIHSFLYNHYQYNADGYDQNLRSPKCSWASRYEGIDCKSYATTASVLLSILNIKHYLRRIKQPFHKFPNKYTHVYVNVPIDQKTGSLTTQGYYTIDGTLRTMQEPVHTNPDDIFMNNQMPHYALNGSGMTDGINDDIIEIEGTETTETTEDSGWLRDTWGSVKDYFKDIDFGSFVSGIFGGGGNPCIYDATVAEKETNDIKLWIEEAVAQLAVSASLNQSSQILTELYFRIVNFSFYRKWSFALVECAAPLAAAFGDSIVNQELPNWFAQINTKLQAKGISLQLSPVMRMTESLETGTYHDAIFPGAYELETMKVTLIPFENTGSNTSTGTTTGTTAGTTSPTGQQDNDPPKKESNTGKIVGGLLVATAIGVGIKAYMNKQKNNKPTPENKAK